MDQVRSCRSRVRADRIHVRRLVEGGTLDLERCIEAMLSLRTDTGLLELVDAIRREEVRPDAAAMRLLEDCASVTPDVVRRSETMSAGFHRLPSLAEPLPVGYVTDMDQEVKDEIARLVASRSGVT